MHCDGPVSGFPAVSEYMYVKDLYTNVSRYENNPEPKPKASKRLSIGPSPQTGSYRFVDRSIRDYKMLTLTHYMPLHPKAAG